MLKISKPLFTYVIVCILIQATAFMIEPNLFADRTGCRTLIWYVEHGGSAGTKHSKNGRR
jgi:hypothetical protein